MSAEREYILGTEGHPDYLVVASRSGFKIGIKPVFEAIHYAGTPTGLYVLGLRVRVVADDGIAFVHVGHSAKEVFAQFPFQNVDDVRASAFIGSGAVPPFFLNLTPEEFIAKLEEDSFITRIVQEIIPFLHNGQGVYDARYTVEEIHQFFIEVYTDKHKEFTGYKDHDPEAPVAKVIPFKPKH